MKAQNRVLTLAEATKYLGYSRSYMYKLTHSGVLPFSKPNNKKIFFDRELLEKWMLQNPRTPHSEKKDEAANYVNTKGDNKA